ncbi:hypothetical protein [Bacillus methanolicus]|uniref:Uncharacterized protein n=1 Tax=Bacillus methanolicus (strain MGA3 / ATCC 53907) TaxID=796606 RepID=I3EBT2_BACMM|nr:hypothetical protein [Bacillus methanolicus]AIE61634.1 hypothetical protein BMMGA3_16405 [Bacillus methanolicus MGA3]EIJ83953.1 hypothetical protein MGA3_01635 [Bacillus methanolicus MGA3]
MKPVRFKSLKLNRTDILTISHELEIEKDRSREYKEDVKDFVIECLRSSDFLDVKFNRKVKIF